MYVQDGGGCGDSLPGNSLWHHPADQIHRHGDQGRQVSQTTYISPTLYYTFTMSFEHRSIHWHQIKETGRHYLNLPNKKQCFFCVAKRFATLCTNEYKRGIWSLLTSCSKGSSWLQRIRTTCSPWTTSPCGTVWPWRTLPEDSSTTCRWRTTTTKTRQVL